MKKKNIHPLPGVLYQITGGTGEKCLINGNTWSESIINKDKLNKPANRQVVSLQTSKPPMDSPAL